MATAWTQALSFGDTLAILRTYLADESIDLVSLDPPLNSQVPYNTRLRAPRGIRSPAQIEALEDPGIGMTVLVTRSCTVRISSMTVAHPKGKQANLTEETLWQNV